MSQETLARLADTGISPAGEIPPPLRQIPVAVLTAPGGGRPILLTEAAAGLSSGTRGP